MAVKKDETIDVVEIKQGRLVCNVLGTSPLVLNAMSAKVKQGLLAPAKKNAAEKASTLKHNPEEEFRSSAYRAVEKDAPTRIIFPAVSFKAALADAAKDLPGAAKAQVGRLTYVEGDYVPIYGTPRLWMTVVRDASINRTPDIRTRAILPEWACRISITFISTILKEITVGRLLAAAGIMRGIGDGRPEKGKMSYGQFELVAADDPRWLKLTKTAGRVQQDAAFADPQPYDGESAELLTWWKAEAVRRGFKVA
jgi:hypothetical protein